jgi:ABC-2 type transport system permease protein
MLFLGGVFFPISSMPNWLQHIARFLPLTHFSGAMRDVMTKGAGLGAIKGDLFAMLAWVATFIGLVRSGVRAMFNSELRAREKILN